MGELSPWHWAIVILVLVLLFGAKRLPDAARGIGRSARILKAELHPDAEDAATSKPNTDPPAAAAAAPSAQTQSPAAASPPVALPTPQATSPHSPTPAEERPAAPATADPLITTSQTPLRHD